MARKAQPGIRTRNERTPSVPALRSRLEAKLLLGPLLITLVLVKLIGTTGQVTQVTIFEAAMAPQIGAAIVAMEHKLDPPLVTLWSGSGSRCRS